MKTIGLLGGMSWESTAEYYRIINEEVKERLGSSHSAKIVMYSFDFAEIEALQNQGDWDTMTTIMTRKALDIKKAGADCIVICTNTMHKMADTIRKVTDLPLIHIADETGRFARKNGIVKVLLLGTQFTMEGDFYKNRLSLFDVETVIPDKEDRQLIHNVIYDELIKGIISDISRKKFIAIIKKHDVEGVVLGCTEIPLLIRQEDVDTFLLNTTELHAKGAVNHVLEEE